MEATVACDVELEASREKVGADLDVFVDDPEFIELCSLVLNLGAGKGKHIPRLVEFAHTFVDPKQRQLRLRAFAEANKLPLEAPSYKVGMLMGAYRKT